MQMSPSILGVTLGGMFVCNGVDFEGFNVDMWPRLLNGKGSWIHYTREQSLHREI